MHPGIPSAAQRPTVARFAALALTLALTLGEWRLFDRLLFCAGEDLTFVADAVTGILHGTPAFPAWQQRLLMPAIVVSLEAIGLSRPGALRLLFALGLFASQLLLLSIARARGASWRATAAALIGFGFARLMLVYRLEYPWDAIDVLLFMLFGAWAARPTRLIALAPLLLVGTFNHETVLYIPLWLLLAGPRRARAIGGLTGLSIAALVHGLRTALYVGPPAAAQQAILGNELHLSHNLRQLFFSNWIHGRIFLSLVFFAATGACFALLRVRSERVAALWSLCLLGALLCFGYVNETRLYLPLLAFWSGYAWPVRWHGPQEHAHAVVSAPNLDPLQRGPLQLAAQIFDPREEIIRRHEVRSYPVGRRAHVRKETARGSVCSSIEQGDAR